MKNTLQHIILSLVAALLFMACSSGTTSTSETDVIPTAATFSAAIDGDVYVTLPISQLGLAEADLSGASMVVYRNEVLWDYDLDASVLYNTDNLSLYFVLVQMEAGDDIRVELETSDGRTATYTGSISETEDFTADVSSTDMPVTAGTDTTDAGDTTDITDEPGTTAGDGEIGETYESNANGADPLYVLVSTIDENGTATITIPMDVFEHAKFKSEYDQATIYQYSTVEVYPLNTNSDGFDPQKVSDIYDGTSDNLVLSITNLEDGDKLDIGMRFYDGMGWSEDVNVSSTEAFSLLMDYYIQDRTTLD